jgi:branched-chain amino acid transport system permease protein
VRSVNPAAGAGNEGPPRHPAGVPETWGATAASRVAPPLSWRRGSHGALGRLAWGVVGLAAVALAAARPGSLDTLLVYGVLAQSWNLIGGLAGYASFGQVVFFGVGGYVTALGMSRLGLPFLPAAVCGGLAAMLFGLAVGDLVLRVRGLYFAVATLVLAEATKAVLSSWPGLAGPSGVLTITTVGLRQPTPRPSAVGFDALYLALVVAAAAGTWVLQRSRLGDALAVVRDDEDLAGALGIAVRPAKVAAFALSGALAGLAGGVYAFQVVALSPTALFAPLLSVIAVAAVVAGGSGVLRPLRGAVLLWLVAAGIGSLVPGLTDLLVAVLIVAVVLVEEAG